MKPGRNGVAGFTLIEMIVVMTVSAILAAVIGLNISRPIQGFIDTARRAALVDAADLAASRVTREARLALPNSVRVTGGGTAVEFLRTRTGGRYRALDDPANAATTNELAFIPPIDGIFDVISALQGFTEICASNPPNSCGGPAASTVACMQSPLLDCLVVYNTGQPANCASPAPVRTNAYCGDNVAGISVANDGTGQIEYVHDGGVFPLASPQQRFHIVDTPVSYICNIGARTLTRYDSYPITPTQRTDISAPPLPIANARLVADNVIACEFTYDPGTSSRAATIGISLTLSDPMAPNERVSMYRQAQVPNVP